MPADDLPDDDGESFEDGDASSPLMARARRLRDGPFWLGLAPLLILGAALLATAFGSVALTLAILFIGAAAWGFVVWRFVRER